MNTVYQCDEYRKDYLPSRAPEFMEWLQEKIAKTGAEPGKVVIDFDAREEYDSYEVYLSLEYDRPETREDIAKREKAMRQAVAREKAQYEALKAKFGD